MKPTHFEIRIAGDWTAETAEQFADVATSAEAGYVVLRGDLDQAALHGLLERIRMADLELIDVRRIRPPRRASHG